MSIPIITDPWFYAVTVPAVLLLGVRKSRSDCSAP